MKYLQSIFTFFTYVLIATSIFSANSFAKKIEDIITESEDELSYSETPSSEDSIKALINRIEILEHKVSQLEKAQVTHEPHNATDEKYTEPPVSSNDKHGAEENTHTSKEKRDYDQALSIFKDGHFAKAVTLFEDFIESYPDSKLSSNAFFWYGESYFRQQSFEKAALYYLKGYKKSPKGTKAADSLLKLAISLGEIKKEKEACATLEKLKKEFPKRSQVSLKKASELEKKFSCSAPLNPSNKATKK